MPQNDSKNSTAARLKQAKQAEELTVNYYKELAAKKESGQKLNDQETAFFYLWQQADRLEQAYQRTVRNNAILVPSDDCRDYIEKYGEAVHKELSAKRVLSSYGFSGKYPDDLEDFLEELTS